jgi:hypothetical protein
MERLGPESKEVIRQILHEVMTEVVSEARSNLQNNGNIVTGDLHASIEILEEKEVGGTIMGEVGTEVFYAIYIEFGRGMVFPVTAQVLHWINPETGEDVFARFSREFEGAPFLEPAVIVKTKDFADRIHEALTRRLNELV